MVNILRVVTLLLISTCCCVIFVINMMDANQITDWLETLSPEKSINNIQSNISRDKNVSYILLWTQIRSGSRFTGQLITLNFDVYYIEEPVADLYISGTKDDQKINVSSFLKDILGCNHRQYPRYMALKMQFDRSNNKDLKFMSMQNDISEKEMEKFDEAMCHSSRYRFSRVVIPTLDAIEPLMNYPNFKDIRILMLIRDPRAIWNSKKNLANKQLVYLNDVCVKQRSDIKGLDKLLEKHFHKFFILRFEDLALQPVNVTKELYKFLGFPFTPTIKNYIIMHTQFEPIPNYSYDIPAGGAIVGFYSGGTNWTMTI